jgi:hypothetical protein
MDLQRLLAETKDSKVGRLAGNGQDHWRELVRLQAVSHAVTGLGLLDPDAARRASNEISFHPLVGAMLIDTIVRPRSGNDKDLRERLLADIVRLNLALSWFHSRPLEAFDILHGLPDAFWSALGKAAFRSHRRIGLGEDVNAYLSAVVVRVKSDWPAAVARPLPGQEAEFTQSSRRFLSVAELLDRAAVEQLSENGDRPLAWPSYLPFALVAAGSSVRGSDTVAASAAFGRALQLANEVSSPAREWALVWNAVAWNAAGSENDRRAAAEAVARASTLRTHRSLEPALAALVGQISRLDASAGLRVARTAHPRLRAGALTAVVAAGRLTH